MDDLVTAGQLAVQLGTSAPRIHRAVRAGRLRPAATDPRGRLLFDPRAERDLRSRWGTAPRVEGRSPAELRVLSALARRPFGLRSARQVARAAGVSPTTASRALVALRAAGLVERRRTMVAEGEAKEVASWTIDWLAPEWRQIAPLVGRVELPEARTDPRAPVPRISPRRVPRRFWHMFWETNPASLDLRRHAPYVIRRVLENGDGGALSWLLNTLPREQIRSVGAQPGRLDRDARRLARALTAGAR